MATAKILCSFAGGLSLRLMGRQEHEDELGRHPFVPVGEPVEVRGPARGETEAVETELDAEFVETWFEQNAQSPLVTSGAIRRS